MKPRISANVRYFNEHTFNNVQCDDVKIIHWLESYLSTSHRTFYQDDCGNWAGRQPSCPNANVNSFTPISNEENGREKSKIYISFIDNTSIVIDTRKFKQYIRHVGEYLNPIYLNNLPKVKVIDMMQRLSKFSQDKEIIIYPKNNDYKLIFA